MKKTKIVKQFEVLSLLVLFACSLNGQAQEDLDANDNIDIYICIGQSNMSGRTPIEDKDLTYDDNVFLLNGNNEFEVAKNTAASGYSEATPLPNYGYNRYSTIASDKKPQMLGPVYTFGRGMAERYPTRNIGFIVQGTGGDGASAWTSTNAGGFFDKTIKRLTSALDGYPNAKVKGLIMAIGESDRPLPVHTIKSDLLNVIENFRSHTDINDPNLPVYMTEIVHTEYNGSVSNDPYNATIASLIYDVNEFYVISSAECETKWRVDSNGTPTVKDTHHFNAEGQRTLGNRLANVVNMVETFRASPETYTIKAVTIPNVDDNTKMTITINVSGINRIELPPEWSHSWRINGVSSSGEIFENIRLGTHYINKDASDSYYFKISEVALSSNDLVTGIFALDTNIHKEDVYLNQKDVSIIINGGTGVSGSLVAFDYSDTSIPFINADVGDDIQFVVKSSVEPVISGLPDVWIAHAFRESIFMSSKSITPGAYKPAIRHSTRPHTSKIMGDFIKWDSYMYDPEPVDQKYPGWQSSSIDGENYYIFKWTLQRAMSYFIVNEDGESLDHTDQYYEEELVPWWQSTAKKQVGSDNRQGKMVGMDIVNTHALMGDLATAYPSSLVSHQFEDNNFYYSKTDSDDVITDKFKDPVSTTFTVSASDATMQVPLNELWKAIPSSEADNPVVDMVTWYQKAKHVYDSNVGSLPSNYSYQGYEIYEKKSYIDGSTAPGIITLTVNNSDFEIWADVKSPIQSNTFYNLYKSNDESDGLDKDRIVTTDYLELDFEEQVRSDMIDEIDANKGSFQIVYGREGSSPKDDEDYIGSSLPKELKKPNDMIPGRMYYTPYDVAIDDSRNLEMVIPNESSHAAEGIPLVGGGLQHVFLTYRRTPKSEAVIIGGYDFWMTSKLKYTRSEAFHNDNDKNRMTSMREDVSKKFNVLDNNIFVDEFLRDGYFPTKLQGKVTEVYVVEVGDTEEFRTWDAAPYAMIPTQTEHQINYQVSSRRKGWRLNESQSAKRIKWQLLECDPGGDMDKGWVKKNPITIQDFGEGDKMSIEYTFNTPGVYSIRARTARKKSYYDAIVNVVPKGTYKNDEVAVIKYRALTDDEIGYLDVELGAENHSIDKDNYKVAMVSMLKSSYAWDDGPRSYEDTDGTTKFIDRFAPYNDYAATYIYDVDPYRVDAYTEQFVDDVQSYLESRQSDFSVIDYYAHHFAPITSFKEEFSLTINDITPSYIEDVFDFTISNTDSYTAQVLDWKTNNFEYSDNYIMSDVNSRMINPWEVRLPWVNETKYYGTRVRTSIKTLMKVDEMKSRILSDWFEPVSKTPYPTIGFLNEDDEKREYEFFLNLKHNRWVIIPNDIATSAMKFYHPLDENKVIASPYTEPAKSKYAYIVLGGDLVAGSDENTLRPGFAAPYLENAYVYDPTTEDFVTCAPADNGDGLNRFSMISHANINGYSVAYPLAHYLRNYLNNYEPTKEVALIMAGKSGVELDHLQSDYVETVLNENLYTTIVSNTNNALDIEGVDLKGIIYIPTEEYDVNFHDAISEDTYAADLSNLQEAFERSFNIRDLKLFVIYDNTSIGSKFKEPASNPNVKTIAVSKKYLEYADLNKGIKKIGIKVGYTITNPTNRHSLLGGYGFNYDESSQINQHMEDVRKLLTEQEPGFIVTSGGDNYQYDANNGISNCISCDSSGEYSTPDPENDIDLNVGTLYYEYLYDEDNEYKYNDLQNILELNQFFPVLSTSDYKAPGFNDGVDTTDPNFHLENTWLDYFPTEQYADEITDNTNASAEGKYYDFTRGNIHYFMVNNSIDYTMEGIETNAINQLDSRTTNELCAADTGSWSGAVTCKQYYWLKDKLENSNAPYKIVVMGTPPYSSAVTKTPESVQETLRLPFKNWGATMVVSGGSTIYERLKVDDLTYLVNGLGGYPDLEVDDAINNKSNHSEYLNKHVEWGAINVQEQKNYLLFEFHTTNGKKRDWFKLFPDGKVSTMKGANEENFIQPVDYIFYEVLGGITSVGVSIYFMYNYGRPLFNMIANRVDNSLRAARDRFNQYESAPQDESSGDDDSSTESESSEDSSTESESSEDSEVELESLGGCE